jgi:hypothetical protein
MFDIFHFVCFFGLEVGLMVVGCFVVLALIRSGIIF